MLVADIKGWQQNLQDPTLGAKLAANVYGKDQKLTVDRADARVEGGEPADRDGRHQGERSLHDHADALIDENISTLALAGITITKDKLFDMSLLAEVYSEHPELKTYTTA